MTEVLGYSRFAAQGGDWGAFVASVLGHGYPKNLTGIHLNLLAVRRDPKMAESPTAEEKTYLKQLNLFLKEETGYQWIQGTKPQTLAFGLSDSPAGLGAWIVEKFRQWTDCDGNPENAVSRDEMLANISLYWFTGCIGASFWPYYTRMHAPWPIPDGATIDVPTGYAEFPGKSCARRAPLPPAPTPTSAAGARCRRAATSRHSNNPRRLRARSSSFSAPCAEIVLSRNQAAPCSTMRAAFSPIMIDGALVFPDVSVGMIEASATRSPEMPRTRRLSSTTAAASLPIRQVPDGMIRRLGGAGHEVEQVLVGFHLRARRELRGPKPSQRRRLDDAAHRAHAGEHAVAIGIIGQEIETDGRRLARVRGCHVDAALALGT